MNEDLEKEFYFLRNFEIQYLQNLEIEKLIVCENIETNSVIFVYLKTANNNWQKYFLDGGAGFWEDTEIIDFENLDDKEDVEDFVFKNYFEELEIKNQIIRKIHCEPNDENCQIIIEFVSNKKIILRCKNSKLFDSDCEIVKE